MLALNKAAAETLPAFAVHAVTDVTGFGLLGHAAEMAEGSQTGLVFHAAQVPALALGLALAAKGLEGGSRDNQRFLESKVTVASQRRSGPRQSPLRRPDLRRPAHRRSRRRRRSPPPRPAPKRSRGRCARRRGHKGKPRPHPRRAVIFSTSTVSLPVARSIMRTSPT